MPAARLEKKLTKPTPDFPLSPHPQGYWCKKIKGKLHYFGARWCEPEEALQEYLKVKDGPPAGSEPPASKPEANEAAEPKAAAKPKKVAKPKKKLTKPSPDFPLTPHPGGYWCKKIKGKLHYFGAKWGDPDDALREYLEVKEDLLAGREPRTVGLSVKDAANIFLADCDCRVSSGELTPGTFAKYRNTCRRFVDHFGADREVASLRPTDFTTLKATFAKEFGHHSTVGDEVRRTKTVFGFLYESNEIDKPVVYGPTFRRPNARLIRQQSNDKPAREFTADEIRTLHGAACDKLKAMILLGINCGLGNDDCAKLEIKLLQEKPGWLAYPRPKTGVARRCPLWPETIEAIETVLDARPHPKVDAAEPLVFLSYRGAPYQWKQNGNINQSFRKLTDKTKTHREGVGFYSLRHMTATVGSRSKDKDAVDHIMGHTPNDVQSGYREWIDDERLEAVVGYIREWLGPLRDSP